MKLIRDQRIDRSVTLGKTPSMIDRMRRLKPLVVENPWQAPVFFAPEAVSTMEEALELHRRGAPAGTVVAAGHQSGGRGRLKERHWQSPPGLNLLFTIILVPDPSIAPPSFPVRAGLGLCLALEKASGLRPLIRWPNDLLLEGRKAAGILCEWKEGFVLLGIGLNCNQLSFPPELEGRAASLRTFLNRRVSRQRLLGDILVWLHAVLRDSDWRGKLQERLFLLGQGIEIRDPISRRLLGRGIFTGIGEEGALLLGSRRFFYGEMRKI